MFYRFFMCTGFLNRHTSKFCKKEQDANWHSGFWFYCFWSFKYWKHQTSTSRWVLHPRFISGRSTMGLPKSCACWIPAKRAIHWPSHHVAQACAVSSTSQRWLLQLPCLQNTPPSWYVPYSYHPDLKSFEIMNIHISSSNFQTIYYSMSSTSMHII